MVGAAGVRLTFSPGSDFFVLELIFAILEQTEILETLVGSAGSLIVSLSIGRLSTSAEASSTRTPAPRCVAVFRLLWRIARSRSHIAGT